MPVLREAYCNECKKIVYFEYIPGISLDNSYWQCRRCGAITYQLIVEE